MTSPGLNPGASAKAYLRGRSCHVSCKRPPWCHVRRGSGDQQAEGTPARGQGRPDPLHGLTRGACRGAAAGGGYASPGPGHGPWFSSRCRALRPERDVQAAPESDEVDDRDLSLAAWKTKAEPAMKIDKKIVLDEDEIRKMFAPRTMTQKNPDEPAGAVGIVRAVKKKAFAGDNDTEVKDFLVDPDEGLIGSQG